VIDRREGMTNRKEEESKERCVIPSTNAIVNPRTMMIAAFDAVIT
jgi:hypothetical protein